ncbi:Ral guanine nucleotide dissociation stimulator [Fukomys damarensis]|uniref:Ral guanine nucleotide dissociation stimulator n=1 Tax=Fukomys damarensis TaxID=885580 RepID=A0A091DU12_FUKDA|nr:Ral guanine nucleotide dissociation stimulator [Fukomys damarensis]
MFQELSEIFSDENNYNAAHQGGTSKFATLEMSPGKLKGRQRRHWGTVPYLGTFLTDLMVLDTAMKHCPYGGLINFERRRKEFEPERGHRQHVQEHPGTGQEKAPTVSREDTDKHTLEKDEPVNYELVLIISEAGKAKDPWRYQRVLCHELYHQL